MLSSKGFRKDDQASATPKVLHKGFSLTSKLHYSPSSFILQRYFKKKYYELYLLSGESDIF